MLEYLYQELEQLAIVKQLPESVDQREAVVNRALDIRSSCMVYLAQHISHQSTQFGVIGIYECLFQ